MSAPTHVACTGAAIPFAASTVTLTAPLMTAPALPDTGTVTITDPVTATDRPWTVVLWNDPVNLVEVVTKVLVRVLQIAEADAFRLMLTAHTEGRAAVFAGTQDHARNIADALGSYDLWATLEKGE